LYVYLERFGCTTHTFLRFRDVCPVYTTISETSIAQNNAYYARIKIKSLNYHLKYIGYRINNCCVYLRYGRYNLL